MAYKFGKRGGIYRIQNGKKVYLRKKASKTPESKKKKSNFGLFIQPYIKNIAEKKKKVIENLIIILKKIEKGTGRKIILDYDELLPAISQASKILHDLEIRLTEDMGIRPRNVYRNMISILIPFLLREDTDIRTMSDFNLNELILIIERLNYHYDRIFIKYLG
jgi:hypothetical protein